MTIRNINEYSVRIKNIQLVKLISANEMVLKKTLIYNADLRPHLSAAAGIFFYVFLNSVTLKRPAILSDY